MVELNIDIEGDTELSRKLLTTPGNLDNLSGVFYRIGNEVRRSIDSNYSSRGSLFGSKWVKRKDNLSHPLLEKSKRMRGNFRQSLGSDYVEIYNPTSYFKYHQSNQARKKIPRRVMMKIDKERKVFIVKEFQKHITSTINKS